eukprot:m.105750 g.105750  ORF g.105750 m.105750 type:complete len:389 (+) comp13285_c0_seq4:235-1401(+)
MVPTTAYALLVTIGVLVVANTTTALPPTRLQTDDDDDAIVHSPPRFVDQADRKVAVPLQPLPLGQKYRSPTNYELDTMNIALVTLAAAIRPEAGYKVAGWVNAACITFSSFRHQTNFKNVDCIVVVRDKEWAFPPDAARAAEQCNLNVVFRPFAIKDKEVLDDTFREALQDKAVGGIGLLDYDFLWPWSFTEYDRVFAMDADMFFAKNVDHLFVIDATLVHTNGPKSLVNGGFQLLRPESGIFEKMKRAILGLNAFNRTTGWYEFGLRPVDQYGAGTLQGFLTYWFYAVDKRVVEVSRAEYNCQFDHMSIDLVENCDQVYLFHFTGCPKPNTHSVAEFEQIKLKKDKPPLCDCGFYKYKKFAFSLGFQDVPSKDKESSGKRQRKRRFR